MAKDKPLLSISIPTRNRQYYCIEAIKHILSYDNQDFELCIHDHSDDRTIEEFISTIEDKRLKYIYTTEAISSSENMSRSIQMTNGEYVCMIGDDDTVLPTTFKWVKYMKENDIDSICPGYRPEYYWPNKETGNTGTLKIVQYKNMQKIEKVDPMERLEKLFQNAIIDYQEYNLPRVYHGLVKKDVFSKIYEKMGTYFAGLSPDIYSTVALSSLVKNHFVINQTISIAGACPISTTSQGKYGEHKGDLSKTPHLKNNKDYVWDELIPAFYSVETIWAESAIKSARDFNLFNIIKSFNQKEFYIKSLSRNRDIKDLVLLKLNLKCNKSKLKYLFLSYLESFKSLITRIFSKIFMKITTKVSNISNISEASNKC